MSGKILVTREVFDETIAHLKQHFEVESNQQDRLFSREELIAKLQGKAGVQTSSSDRIDGDLLDRCPGLRAVCNTAVGFNNIDVEACTKRGVMVTNTPGVLTESVADLSMGLVIATCRRITEGEAYLRAGQWKGNYLKQMLGQDVHGATLGIVGFGRIGQAIARRARGFDMKVLYHSRHRVDAAVERQAAVTYAGKDDLLRQADIVLLILPYTPQTHHFIGARELSLMKRSAVLVNMARGGIVDDGALAAALKAGTIWAAGLDVYENEPHVNPALLELRNVVLTPHIASATTPTRQAMAMTAAKNLVAALSGEVPPNLLNPDYRNHLKG
ncbi:MAG TPA: D-glycerate dehydrogenase [Burkholderiales bacterium]|jgi:glyoxylate reductase|nr:D-glycerate dehydrogenase [Burkholderiales bacterium]